MSHAYVHLSGCRGDRLDVLLLWNVHAESCWSFDDGRLQNVGVTVQPVTYTFVYRWDVSKRTGAGRCGGTGVWRGTKPSCVVFGRCGGLRRPPPLGVWTSSSARILWHLDDAGAAACLRRSPPRRRCASRPPADALSVKEKACGCDAPN